MATVIRKDANLFLLHQDVCCAASEAAVHVSYTGKISIRLSASVGNYTTMPRALATVMLCDTWLHNDTFCEFFRARKKPLLSQFYSFCKDSWEAYQNFGVQKRSSHSLLIYLFQIHNEFCEAISHTQKLKKVAIYKSQAETKYKKTKTKNRQQQKNKAIIHKAQEITSTTTITITT